MSSYREHLARVRAGIVEVSPADAKAALTAAAGAVVIDVREPDEFAQGAISDAVNIPRGWLESRIERIAPQRDAAIILVCESGARSALAARSLNDLGYTTVRSLAGGFEAWKQAGFGFTLPVVLDAAQRRRYGRHLVIPGVGEAGQLRLLGSRVLLIGAGGLGSPAALYLAAAGVGTIGIVDDDVVDESNLQRQVLHTTERIGEPKTASARTALAALNPSVETIAYPTRLNAGNIDQIIAGYDVVIDGSDNFPTRYLVNDASVKHRIPLVHAAVFRFEGQLTVIDPGRGPCYRCLFPEPPPADAAPSCAEAGVLGVVPGLLGMMQACEALKLLLGVGRPLVGRLLLVDASDATFHELAVRRDPACVVCGDGAPPVTYTDLDVACPVATPVR